MLDSAELGELSVELFHLRLNGRDVRVHLGNVTLKATLH